MSGLESAMTGLELPGTRLRTVLVDLLAGTLGGVATVAVGQPLDTVKVKMQTYPQLYPGTLTCIRKTLQNDGVLRGLYAGTAPAIVANVAENAVLFCAYGLCQKLVQNIVGRRSIQELSVIENASAGACASIFSSLTLCPTELIKCRLQSVRETKQTNNATMYKMIRSIFREEGIRGFFRGLTPTIAREMPGYFSFFGGYEGSRTLFSHYYQVPKQDIGTAGTAISGGVGGICLWLVIFPADLVKSRMQVLATNKPTLQVTRELVQQHGLRSLYSGLLPTLIRTFPATGVLFLTVEHTKRLLS